jgi:hypothetical protein
LISIYYPGHIENSDLGVKLSFRNVELSFRENNLATIFIGLKLLKEVYKLI